MRSFAALLLAEVRNFTRDKLMLFFTLLFPVVFILLFGFLFSGMGDAERAEVGFVLESAHNEELLLSVLSEAGVGNTISFPDREELEAAISDHRVDFGLIWTGDDLRFLYDPGRLQENVAFQQIAGGIAAEFDMRAQGAQPAITVHRIHAGEIESTGWFNLVLPGILAFTILSSGLFAVSGHLTQMKERKILDRLIVTPMRPTALLIAIAIVRLVVGLISTFITLGVGMLIFRLNFTVDWVRYILFVVCSTLGTMGLGTVIALLVRRPSSAGNLANVLAMIMMFLAGIYFPIEFMPGFLRTISAGLPLTHMANVMRSVTGVMDMSDIRYWLTTAAFLGLAIVLFPLMARYVVKPLRR